MKMAYAASIEAKKSIPHGWRLGQRMNRGKTQSGRRGSSLECNPIVFVIAMALFAFSFFSACSGSSSSNPSGFLDATASDDSRISSDTRSPTATKDRLLIDELSVAPLCPNTVRESGEACDGADLGGQTCKTLGYAKGELKCTADCYFDTTGCASEKSCNNGVQDEGERDVDCGGSVCLPCTHGQGCRVPEDCVSQECRDGACFAEKDYVVHRAFFAGPDALTKSERIIVEIARYTIGEDGLIAIGGAEFGAGHALPRLPQLEAAEKTLPDGTSQSVSLNAELSRSTIIKHNEIPLSCLFLPCSFDYDGFYPEDLYRSYDFFTLGASAKEIGFIAYPVHFDPRAKAAKIWNKLVFEVQYRQPPSSIRCVGLSLDKKEYAPGEKMNVTISMSNAAHARAVDLKMVLRNYRTSTIIAEIPIGAMGVKDLAGYKGNPPVTGTYPDVVLPQASQQAAGESVMAELLVLDPNSDSLMNAQIVTFKVLRK